MEHQHTPDDGELDLSYRSKAPARDLAATVIHRGAVVRRRRRVVAGVGTVAVVAGLGLSWQSLTGMFPSPHVNVVAQSSAPSTVTPSTVVPSSISEPTPTPSSRVCAPPDLQVSLGRSDAAMGTVGIEVVFANNGTAPCTMYGYPGVSLATTGGVQIGQDAERNLAVDRPATVTLAVGAAAKATFLVHNGTGYEPPTAAPCFRAPVTGVRVYAPESTKVAVLPWSGQVCTGLRPQVGPVVGQ